MSKVIQCEHFGQVVLVDILPAGQSDPTILAFEKLPQLLEPGVRCAKQFIDIGVCPLIAQHILGGVQQFEIRLKLYGQ